MSSRKNVDNPEHWTVTSVCISNDTTTEFTRSRDLCENPLKYLNCIFEEF